jgi:hypothetical protein
MGWWDIIVTFLGSFAGGLATGLVSGYVFGIVSKPRFEYLGITGNQYDQYLQCAARFRIKYWNLGERFVARNSRGWVGIYDGDRQVHGAPSVWAWGNAVSVDIAGEESLILFLVYSQNIQNIKSPNDPALIIPPTPHPAIANWLPASFSACFNYNNYTGPLICDVKDNLQPNYIVKFRVTAENAHGTEKSPTLREVLNLCIESWKKGGRVMTTKDLKKMKLKMKLKQTLAALKTFICDE